MLMWQFEAESADSCDELFPCIILQAHKVFCIIPHYNSHPRSTTTENGNTRAVLAETCF